MKTKYFISLVFLLSLSKYAQAQESTEKLTKIIAVQRAQIQQLLKFAPGKSCRDIKEKYPEYQNGEYLIAPSASLPPTLVYCDMDNGGWTRIAAFDGRQNVNIASYRNGRGRLGDPNYAIPCANLGSITEREGMTMRVNMGEVRDYFKPLAKVPFCQMLTEFPSNKFTWSSTPDGTYVQPAYYGNHFGGSSTGWPQTNSSDDRRIHLSFWADVGTYTGGCCHATKSDTAAWGRPFEVYIR